MLIYIHVLIYTHLPVLIVKTQFLMLPSDDDPETEKQ